MASWDAVGCYWASGCLVSCRVLGQSGMHVTCNFGGFDFQLGLLLLVVERVVLVQDGGALKRGLKPVSLRMTPLKYNLKKKMH